MLNEVQIRGLRIQNSITQKDLAEVLGVAESTYGRYEFQRILPEDLKAKATTFFKELGVDVDNISDEFRVKPHQKPFGMTRKPRVQEEKDVPGMTITPAQSMPKTTQEDKDSLFHEISHQIAEILAKKNHDYGDSFHNVYKEFGDVSTYIRLQDKVGRLATLAKGTKGKVDESLEDVYRDIAGYAILTLASKERLKQGDE